MTAAVIRFPPRRGRAVWLLPAREGGWLVIARGHGWLHGSRSDALADAQWLALSAGLPVEGPRMITRIEAARFILREAEALGIRVGTDGDELVMLAPLRIPYASRRTFEAALEAHRAEIIAHIIAENTP